jgi:opacity protein-like surface antigen
MRHFLIALILAALAIGGAQAADSCKAQSDAKKLSGAAQTSFMNKCETDAQTACDKQAADKKLSGAAKDSFTKKCVKDATGI